jgi:hypothetical protein
LSSVESPGARRLTRFSADSRRMPRNTSDSSSTRCTRNSCTSSPARISGTGRPSLRRTATTPVSLSGRCLPEREARTAGSRSARSRRPMWSVLPRCGRRPCLGSLAVRYGPSSTHRARKTRSHWSHTLRHISQPEVVPVWSASRKENVDATKTVFIESFPAVLILHLKRFVYDPLEQSVVKKGKAVGYGTELVVPPGE